MIDYSREDTTHRKVAYLQQVVRVPDDLRHGGPVARSLRDAQAQTLPDPRSRPRCGADGQLRRWPVRPKTLILSYIADLGSGEGPAAVAMVALLPGNVHAAKALEVHPCSVLTLVRNWRADDLGPAMAPDLMPQVLRRLVGGCKRSGIRSLGDEWTARKIRPGGLYAIPRLLVSYADPGVGHDGGLYRGAGATFCGPGTGGRLLFAWALDPALRDPLRQLGQAAAER